MTVRDLVRSALRMSAGMAPGQTPETDEGTDALFVLNAMLDSWNTDRLNIYTIAAAQYDLVAGQQSYTIGPNGDFDTVRPQRIESANLIFASMSPELRRPIEMVNDDQWADIRLVGINSSVPLKLYNDGAYPLSTLYLWPGPTSDLKLELYTWQPLTAFSSLNDTISLPAGYADAIRYNLGVRIASEWGRALRPDVAQLAIESKAALQSINTPKPVMSCDAAILRGRRPYFNWLTGE